MNANNCYNCQWMSRLPGTAHITCRNPLVVQIGGIAMLLLMTQMPQEFRQALGFSANQHGFNNGWFDWPLLYDPVWMEGECKLFEGRNKKEE